MANIFRIRESEYEYTRIKKEIRDRVDVCYAPVCWELKDPDDNGQIYLDKNILDEEKGRHVQIRRLLFLTTWQTLPDRRKLIMRCHNHRCINPAHATYKGFKPPFSIVKNLASGGKDHRWLTEKQLDDWYSDGG
jgi:hypothetical protein